MAIWNLDDFRECRGWWHKLLRFACKRGFAPAQRYCRQKVTQALKYEVPMSVDSE